MPSEGNTTPDDLGPTTPKPKDLYPTSDIRFVMIEVAKLEERVNSLIEDNKAHKSDFRWTWTGLVAGFLILAGMFIYGYNRLEDKNLDIAKATVAISTKLDDLSQRLPSSSPARR